MKRQRYRLRKNEGNYFSRSGKTIFLNIPVTSKKLNFEEKGIVNISTHLINAILVKLAGDVSPTPPEPIKKEIIIKIKSNDIKLDAQNLKRDRLLIIAFYNDSDSLNEKVIERFKQVIIDAKSDYHSAVSSLRTPGIIKIKRPNENDGDVIGGNG